MTAEAMRDATVHPCTDEPASRADRRRVRVRIGDLHRSLCTDIAIADADVIHRRTHP